MLVCLLESKTMYWSSGDRLLPKAGDVPTERARNDVCHGGGNRTKSRLATWLGHVQGVRDRTLRVSTRALGCAGIDRAQLRSMEPAAIEKKSAAHEVRGAVATYLPCAT